MERGTLLDRQREGVAIAKANGVSKRRLKGTTDSIEDILFKYKSVVKHTLQCLTRNSTESKICY